jgi:hypothetical protein
MVEFLRARSGLDMSQREPVARKKACPLVRGVLSTFLGGADCRVIRRTIRKASVEDDWQSPPTSVGPAKFNPIPASIKSSEEMASQVGRRVVLRKLGRTIMATPIV